MLSFSLIRWILRHPSWARLLYFLSVVVFFSESSFADGKFYLEAGLFALFYGVWCRPFWKIVNWDLQRKGFPQAWKLEKFLLLHSSWLFILVPFKLVLVDFWWEDSRGIIKFLIFLTVGGVILYQTGKGFLNKNKFPAEIFSLSLVKNFSIIFVIPIITFLISPILILILIWL